jgi:16S rRNA processing protein RimM
LPDPGRVVIGRIARAHALAGGVRVRPEGPTAAGLEAGDVVEVVGRDGSVREMTVAERAGDAARPILRFHEVTDRTAAEGLRNALLRVADDAVGGELDDGTYFVRDLIGCAVVAGRRELGEVVEIHSGPANDNLEVNGPGGRLLLPFTLDAVTRVSLTERRIEIRADLLPESI